MNIKNLTSLTAGAPVGQGRVEQRSTPSQSVDRTTESAQDQSAVKLSGLEDPEQRAKRVQELAAKVEDGSYLKNLDTRAVAEKVALDLFA